MNYYLLGILELEQALPQNPHEPAHNYQVLPTIKIIKKYFLSIPTCVLREYYGEEPPPATKRSSPGEASGDHGEGWEQLQEKA